jgi:hypothetical protein
VRFRKWQEDIELDKARSRYGLDWDTWPPKVTRLSKEAAIALLDLLENPPEPPQKLKDLFKLSDEDFLEKYKKEES